MVAPAVQDVRSRFIRAYLLIWGLLAAGGLTYLSTLAWPDWLSPPPPPPPRPQIAEPDPGLRTATKALAEVGAVRNSVSDIEKSIDQLKTSIDQGATREKAVDSRLSALEEKVTSIALQAASPPAAKQKTVEKGKAEKAHKAAEPARAPRIISTAEPKNPVRTIPGDTALETGSIVRSPAIVFGAPVVTRARAAFAIHLASAPSLEALRTSWSLLTEQHGETLARLEARYVAPHAAGGNYRLVAGPLASAAEVDRVCRELQALSVYCASADFAGEPL